MRFNKNNTCLHFLEEGDIDFSLPESADEMTPFKRMDFKQSVIESFKHDGSLFKENVRFVSNTFINAYNKGRSKMIPIFDKIPLAECGTLIWNGKGCTITVFYAIKTSGQGEDWDFKMVFLYFSKAPKVTPALDICYLNDPEEQTTKSFMWKGFADQGATMTEWPAFIITFLIFIKHCEIETKIIQHGRKDKHIGVKYVNESKQDVTILDSTWFTTLISSEAFTVGAENGGFFRWQPWGPNNSLRKLIWVLPFEKEGYTRRAKVEMLRDEKSDT